MYIDKNKKYALIRRKENAYSIYITNRTIMGWEHVSTYTARKIGDETFISAKMMNVIIALYGEGYKLIKEE